MVCLRISIKSLSRSHSSAQPRLKPRLFTLFMDIPRVSRAAAADKDARAEPVSSRQRRRTGRKAVRSSGSRGRGRTRDRRASSAPPPPSPPAPPPAPVESTCEHAANSRGRPRSFDDLSYESCVGKKESAEHRGYIRHNLMPKFTFLLDILHLVLRQGERVIGGLLEAARKDLITHFDVPQNVANEILCSIAKQHVSSAHWDSDKKHVSFGCWYLSDRLKVLREIEAFSFFKHEKVSKTFEDLPEDVRERLTKKYEGWNVFFKTFVRLYDEDLNSKKQYDTAEKREVLQKKIDVWYRLFFACMGRDQVVPYTHAFWQHFVDQVALMAPFFTLGIVRCDPLERKNGMQTATFFRQTRRGGGRDNQKGIAEAYEAIIKLELIMKYVMMDEDTRVEFTKMVKPPLIKRLAPSCGKVFADGVDVDMLIARGSIRREENSDVVARRVE